MRNVLLLPGLYDSGPEHWQSHWEREHHFTRVQQRDWETPDADEWVATLDEAVGRGGEKCVLVAHSLACTLVARWVERRHGRVAGALLVAPSDTESPSYPKGTRGFQPMPRVRLPFPSIVVASNNDEYVTLERAREFATLWGSEFVDAGPLGHINSASGLGPWAEGYALLMRLCSNAAPR